MTKSRGIDSSEYDAIRDRIIRLEAVAKNGSSGTDVYMVDGEFQPTQNVNEMRWLMTDTRFDGHLFQVDSIGDLILLRPV